LPSPQVLEIRYSCSGKSSVFPRVAPMRNGLATVMMSGVIPKCSMAHHGGHWARGAGP